jgi:hypothetical protein
VHAAAGLAGHDQFAIIGKYTASRRVIACESGERLSCFRSHIFTVISLQSGIARCPSGVTATAQTASAWPVRVRSSCPLARSLAYLICRRPSENISTPGMKIPNLLFGQGRSNRSQKVVSSPTNARANPTQSPYNGAEKEQQSCLVISRTLHWIFVVSRVRSVEGAPLRTVQQVG